MRSTSTLFAALALAIACAPPRPTPAPVSTAPAPATAAPAQGGTAVARGMDAAQVRAALGAPIRVDRITSVAADGAGYERWTYQDREVVLLDGKVVDVVP